MRVIAKRTLKLFWQQHAHAEAPLKLWFGLAAKASWSGPADIRAQFASAVFVADNRVIFDIGIGGLKRPIRLRPFRRPWSGYR